MQMSKNAFPVCFHDGAYTGLENATIHAGSIAMRYAVSVFEGIRLYRIDDGGAAAPALKAFALDAHAARLGNSLRLMHLPDPGVDRLAEIIAALVARNGIDDDAYIRPSVSAKNPGDLSVTAESCLTVTATRMGRKKWLAEDRAMTLAISPWQRASEAVFPPAAKNISNYAGARVALLQARGDGYDGIVLTNGQGFLAEAPTAALFLVRGDRLETPALHEGVLPSITRHVIIDLARELGLDVRETRLSRSDAYLADEAFLCGTGIEIAPVRAFDGHALARADARPVTRRLIDAYFAKARARDPSDAMIPLADAPARAVGSV